MQSKTHEFALSTAMNSSGDSGNPFAWLGLLKWSLSYTDGTRPTSEHVAPMSEEDRRFLESVMKEGIIDENERMKTILKQVTEIMDKWRISGYSDDESAVVENLLQELRDIVEQIDFARAFAAMNGLEFLLGCSVERSNSVPRAARKMTLGIIATMCQHNPPIQKKLLELGSLKKLSDLFFDTLPENDPDGSLRARIMQAISANVRSNDLAEEVFCSLEQATALIEFGLGINTVEILAVPKVVRQRTLFFLRAIVTSDLSSRQRIRKFAGSICWILDNLLQRSILENEFDLIEMILDMIQQILEQKKSVNAVLSRKESTVSVAVQRIASIRAMDDAEKEQALEELHLWESILVLLSQAREDEPEPATLQIMTPSCQDLDRT